MKNQNYSNNKQQSILDLSFSNKDAFYCQFQKETQPELQTKPQNDNNNNELLLMQFEHTYQQQPLSPQFTNYHIQNQEKRQINDNLKENFIPQYNYNRVSKYQYNKKSINSHYDPFFQQDTQTFKSMNKNKGFKRSFYYNTIQGKKNWKINDAMLNAKYCDYQKKQNKKKVQTNQMKAQSNYQLLSSNVQKKNNKQHFQKEKQISSLSRYFSDKHQIYFNAKKTSQFNLQREQQEPQLTKNYSKCFTCGQYGHLSRHCLIQYKSKCKFCLKKHKIDQCDSENFTHKNNYNKAQENSFQPETMASFMKEWQHIIKKESFSQELDIKYQQFKQVASLSTTHQLQKKENYEQKLKSSAYNKIILMIDSESCEQ